MHHHLFTKTLSLYASSSIHQNPLIGSMHLHMVKYMRLSHVASQEERKHPHAAIVWYHQLRGTRMSSPQKRYGGARVCAPEIEVGHSMICSREFALANSASNNLRVWTTLMQLNRNNILRCGKTWSEVASAWPWACT